MHIRLDCIPPTATAQQKGVSARNGHVRFFKKKKVKDAEELLEKMLAPHIPAEPFRGAIFVQARWCFPYRKSERKSVTKTGREIPHTSRPDLDNLEKSLLDVLTRLNFWRDDAEVFTKHTAKFWGPSPYLDLAIRDSSEPPTGKSCLDI